jgi:hypothetical protein
VHCKQGAQVEDISGGERALQLTMSVPAPNLILILFDEGRFSKTSFELAPSAVDDFQDITLAERDVIFIVTSEASIRPRKIEAGNVSMLFIGQMPTMVIEQLAKRARFKWKTTGQCEYNPSFTEGEDRSFDSG